MRLDIDKLLQSDIIKNIQPPKHHKNCGNVNL